LAIKGKTAVWGLHHNNKESGKKISDGNDPLLSAGGTAAVLGSAQCAIVFEGDRIPEGIDGANGLYISPRIGQTRKKIIKFHNGRFYQTASDTEVYYHRNQAKTADPQIDLKILTYMEQHTAVTSVQIAEALNIAKYTVDRRLDIMKEKGIAEVSKDVLGSFYKGRGGPPRIWTVNKSVTLPKNS
jgi:hypothetical protein